MLRETADQADGGDAVLEDLVVKGDENGTDILSLCEVPVEALVQRRKHSLPDRRVCKIPSVTTTIQRSAVPTRIRNADSEQLVEHVADNLDRVTACLVADRIPHKQLAARQRTRPSHVCVVVLQVRQRRVSNKLVQHVSYAALRTTSNTAFTRLTAKVKRTKRRQRKRDQLGTLSRLCSR